MKRTRGVRMMQCSFAARCCQPAVLCTALSGVMPDTAHRLGLAPRSALGFCCASVDFQTSASPRRPETAHMQLRAAAPM